MELTTPRLLLREFTAEDLPALLDHYGDPRFAEFYGPEEVGPKATRDLLERFIRWAAEAPRQNFQLAVAERTGSGKAIGSCGIRLQGCEAGVGELGLALEPESWGHGLATEAARAILGFAFRDLGLQEVRGVTVTENLRVQRLVRRLGFTCLDTIPGPAWMRERGWRKTVWRLAASQWPLDGDE